MDNAWQFDQWNEKKLIDWEPAIAPQTRQNNGNGTSLGSGCLLFPPATVVLPVLHNRHVYSSTITTGRGAAAKITTVRQTFGRRKGLPSRVNSLIEASGIPVVEGLSVLSAGGFKSSTTDTSFLPATGRRHSSPAV